MNKTAVKSGVSLDSVNEPGLFASRSRADEIETATRKALLSVSTETIQFLPVSELVTLQSLLRHGNRFGYWETPREWAAMHKATQTNIDLRRRIVDFLPKKMQRQIARQLLPATGNELSGIDENSYSPATRQLSSLLNAALLTLTRYLIVLRMGPAGLGRKKCGVPLDPTSVIGIGYGVMPQLLAVAVCRYMADRQNEFSHSDSLARPEARCDEIVLSVIKKADLNGVSDSAKEGIYREVRRMSALVARGCWENIPIIDDDYLVPSRVVGPEPRVPSQNITVPHLPLPDEYLSVLGARSLWLVYDVAPNLLSITDKFLEIWGDTEVLGLTPPGIRCRRSAQVERFLKDFCWCDRSGNRMDVPLFRPLLGQYKKKKPLVGAVRNSVEAGEATVAGCEDFSEARTWPPRTFSHIMRLLYAVQLAHLCVFALSTGARKSEILSLDRRCVRYARNENWYADGRTFKLSERYDGEARDWVLPDVAVHALQQQVKVINAAEAVGPITPKRGSRTAGKSDAAPMHLWGQISAAGASDRTAPLIEVRQALLAYARLLGMDLKPGGQFLRPHRFRKTVARLVALALTQAPKVLLDVLGHKSIETVMYYILADKELQGEIQKVSRELRVMRAKETIEKMVLEEDEQNSLPPASGYGGPAALMLRQTVKLRRAQLKDAGRQWQASNALELARILTNGGESWQLVRAGVICTKFAGTESGPCNKSKGRPEPANCQPECMHRLEEGFLHEDVDGAIREAVVAYREARANSDELLQALWERQIRLNISRFSDLRVKWMSDPIVQGVMEASAHVKVGDD